MQDYKLDQITKSKASFQLTQNPKTYTTQNEHEAGIQITSMSYLNFTQVYRQGSTANNLARRV